MKTLFKLSKKEKVLCIVALSFILTTLSFAARYRTGSGMWFTGPGPEYFETFGDWFDFCQEFDVVAFMD